MRTTCSGSSPVAGRSTAPIFARDGWDAYTADQVGLLDHLGIERCHVLGGCIGCSYAFGLAAEGRVSAAVLQNPIGVHNNRDAFYEMFDGWAAALREEGRDLDDATTTAFREAMYSTDFVFNVSRDFVSSCQTPLLVLKGNDLYHPAVTSLEVAELAPHAELIEDWKGEENAERTANAVSEFFRAHTPAPS